MSTITAPTLSPAPIPARIYTPFDVLEMSDGVRYELVDGRLVELTMGFLSQRLGFRVGHLLENHCEPSGLAYVVTEAGYTCFPDRPGRMRRPDVSLVLAERMTPELMGRGFLPIRPDLAIEIVSPNDTIYDLEEKLVDYRDAQIPLVWIVIPSTRRVRVLRHNGPTSELGPDDELTADPILPGFRCLVADLFAGLPSAEPAPGA